MMNRHYQNPHAHFIGGGMQHAQAPMMVAAPNPGVQIMQAPNGQMVYVDAMGNMLGVVPQQHQQGMMQRPVGMVSRHNAAQFANNQAPTMVASAQFTTGASMQQETPSTNSRYGNIEQLTQTQQPALQFQPKPTATVAPEFQPQEKPVNQSQVAPPAAAAAVVIQPETPVGITNTRVKLEVRAIPFSNKEISLPDEGTTTYGDSLYEIMTAIRNEAHKDTSDKVVYVRSALVCEKYYGVKLGDTEAGLFKSDIESVYRALKRVSVDIIKKEELCFYNAFNDWVTENINDYLLIATKGKWRIDSFFEDFNDLVGAIVKDKDLREGLTVAMNDALDQANADIQALREKDEDGSSVLEETSAVIPSRTNVVYMKLMGHEIGDLGDKTDPKADILLGGLREYVDTEVFYVTTLDRRLYKVYFAEGSIVFTRID